MQRSQEAVTHTRARQVELYGEPLQTLLGRCAATLNLTQARMSDLLGISAPMLSQLINGHRIKIGNPAAAQRLRWMIQIAQQVENGDLGMDQALDQLQRNAETSEVLASVTHVRRGRHLATEIQEVCRLTASAQDFLEAAALVRDAHPEIAKFLVIYGSERADRAIEHTDRLRRQ